MPYGETAPVRAGPLEGGDAAAWADNHHDELERSDTAAAKAEVLHLTCANDLQPIAAELQALTGTLAEPNVFFDAIMLQPALDTLLPKDGIDCVLIREDTEDRRLIGLMPLMRRPLHKFLPLPAYRFWDHSQCFRSTPLMRTGCEELCWSAFINWFQGPGNSRKYLHIPLLPRYGPISDALHKTLADRPQIDAFTTSQQTAFFDFRTGVIDAEAILERAMGKKTRSNFRRKLRNLEKEGTVVFEELTPDTDIDALSDEFLALENSGWKGKEGTALAAKITEAAFFKSAIARAHAEGRLSLLTMRLDGRLIAARTEIYGGNGGFVFKIAFDETLSRMSPGVLLEIERIKRLDGDDRALAFLDSCSAFNNGPFYRVWPDLMTIEHLRLGAGPLMKTFTARLLPPLYWALRPERLKSLIKSALPRWVYVAVQRLRKR